jgi:hypothetical protein
VNIDLYLSVKHLPSGKIAAQIRRDSGAEMPYALTRAHDTPGQAVKWLLECAREELLGDAPRGNAA